MVNEDIKCHFAGNHDESVKVMLMEDDINNDIHSHNDRNPHNEENSHNDSHLHTHQLDVTHSQKDTIRINDTRRHNDIHSHNDTHTLNPTTNNKLCTSICNLRERLSCTMQHNHKFHLFVTILVAIDVAIIIVQLILEASRKPNLQCPR